MIQSLKLKLKSGAPVVAINVGGNNIDIIDSLKKFGADLAFIDCERTGIGLDVAANLIRACRAASLPCVVRSWSRAPEVIVQYLDRHADGVVIPHVDTALEVQNLVKLMHYACSGNVENKLLIVQIETPESVENVESMANVQGVDVFLIGPNDLSYEMTGKRGLISRPVEEAIQRVSQVLRPKGIPFGMPCKNSDFEKFKAIGANFIYYPIEWIIESGMREMKQAFSK